MDVYTITPEGLKAADEEDMNDGGVLAALYSTVELKVTVPEISCYTNLPPYIVQITLEHYMQQGLVNKSEGTYEDMEKSIHRLCEGMKAKREWEMENIPYKIVLKELFNARIRRPF